MNKTQSITQTVLKAVALGMSVACLVLGYLDAVETATQVSLLAIGVFALSVAALQKNE
jgi:uncharacterized membrane protein (Fun14 family)